MLVSLLVEAMSVLLCTGSGTDEAAIFFVDSFANESSSPSDEGSLLFPNEAVVLLPSSLCFAAATDEASFWLPSSLLLICVTNEGTVSLASSNEAPFFFPPSFVFVLPAGDGVLVVGGDCFLVLLACGGVAPVARRDVALLVPVAMPVAVPFAMPFAAPFAALLSWTFLDLVAAAPGIAAADRVATPSADRLPVFLSRGDIDTASGCSSCNNRSAAVGSDGICSLPGLCWCQRAVCFVRAISQKNAEITRVTA